MKLKIHSKYICPMIINSLESLNNKKLYRIQIEHDKKNKFHVFGSKFQISLAMEFPLFVK